MKLVSGKFETNSEIMPVPVTAAWSMWLCTGFFPGTMSKVWSQCHQSGARALSWVKLSLLKVFMLKSSPLYLRMKLFGFRVLKEVMKVK